MITRITDINDPQISLYHSLKMKQPGEDGIFIVESMPAAKALLKTGFEIVSCLTTDTCYRALLEEEPLFSAKVTQLYIMEGSVIEGIVGFRFHHGVMIAVRSPRRRTTSEISGSWRKPHLLVALNGVHDPQNVGLIARNAAAFGADALIADKDTHEPYYRKVVRVSMGAILKLPVAYENELLPCLKWLNRQYGTKILTTSPGKKSVDLSKTDLTGNICIVLGNEFLGISGDLLEEADTSVRIPLLFEKVNSLNVACAGAIMLYQAAMQRKLI